MNQAGTAATISTAGVVDLGNAFHVPQGSNGRSCGSCHLVQSGWSIRPADAELRFFRTRGTDPIFNLLDADNPNADVSTPQARYAAYSMLRKGLFRRGGDVLVSLLVAGVFAFAPLRALLGELLRVEGKVLHVMHGAGGLGFAGLALSGAISGGPLLNHAALAPFQIMRAAQAIMHQGHPRNAQQAEALRRFATSLPEVRQLTDARNLGSPDGACASTRARRTS